MSNNVDNKIVSITFDNRVFENRVSQTLSTLSDLNRSIQNLDKTTGLNNLDVSNIASGVDDIRDKFSIMGVVGFQVISRLTNAAMDFAGSMAKFSWDTIMGGGKIRAENMEQARFMLQGLKVDVDAVMDSALEAVKGTAYGLDAAAKAAAQFSASGIEAGDEMTGALRAIAGTAAMTNTSFEEMSSIFTSAAGRGKVMGQQLMQFSHRGLNAAAIMGEQWGKTEAEVREMASRSEISFEMFYQAMDQAFGEHATKANETYAGSLANLKAALARMGASFFGARLEHQRDVFNSITPMVDALHDALKPLIDLFVLLSKQSSMGLVKIFDGMTEKMDYFAIGIPGIVRGISNIINAAKALFAPIRDAFRNVFPSDLTGTFYKIVQAFERFSEQIKIGVGTGDRIRRVFEGVFSVFSIGFEVIKGLAGAIFGLFSSFGGGESSLLKFMANLGDGAVALREFLVDSGGIERFFVRLKGYIEKPLASLKNFKNLISNVFMGFSSKTASDAVSGATGRIQERLSGFEKLIKGFSTGLSWLVDQLSTGLSRIVDWFKELGSNIVAGLSGGDFSGVWDFINTGILAGLGVLLWKLKDALSMPDFGLVESIKNVFGELTNTLGALQTKLKADALMSIALALGVLTASVLVLSLIDSAALAKAFTALGVGFGQLVTAMTLMSKIDMTGRTLMGMAAGLLILAGAVFILSLSVLLLSGLEWEELGKGLSAVAGVLLSLSGAIKLMSGNQKGMVKIGISLMAIAVAMLLLAASMKIFATMSWEEIGQGLVSVTGGILGIGIAMRAMPKGIALQAVSILALSLSLVVLGGAMKIFATMSWEEIGKGLGAIAGSLLSIAGAMRVMPKNLPALALGLIGVSIGMAGLTASMMALSTLDMEKLGIGLAAMGGMLLLLSVGLKAMSSTAAGALALIVAAQGLILLSGVLLTLGQMDLNTILTGLGVMAAAFIVLAVAGKLLIAAVPGLLGVGLALLLMGAGFALFGLGVAAVAKGFETLARAGKQGVKIFGEMLQEIVKLIPKFVAGVIKGFAESIGEILSVIPLLVIVFGEIILQVIRTVRELLPEIAQLAHEILNTLIDTIENNIQRIVDLGFAILIAILTGIRDNIGEIVTLVGEIIVEFIDALGEQVSPLIDGVMNFLSTVFFEVGYRIGSAAWIRSTGGALIRGLIAGITELAGEIWPAIKDAISAAIDAFKSFLGINSPSTVFADFGRDIIQGLINGIGAIMGLLKKVFVDIPIDILKWIGNAALTLVQKGKDFLEGLIEGVLEGAIALMNWFIGLPLTIIGWIGDIAGALLDIGKKAIGGILDGVEAVTGIASDIARKFIGLPGKFIGWMGDVGGKFLSVGRDMINGLGNAFGINSTAMLDIKAKVRASVDEIKKAAEVEAGITSPSRVFMEIGNQLIAGLAVGVGKSKPAEVKAAESVRAINEAFEQIRLQLPELENLTPTITPVIDLSEVEQGAARMGHILDAQHVVDPSVSFENARQISRVDLAGKEAPAEPVASTTVLEFNQTINAPEALSTADIYRQTKGQVALAKEELHIP